MDMISVTLNIEKAMTQNMDKMLENISRNSKELWSCVGYIIQFIHHLIIMYFIPLFLIVINQNAVYSAEIHCHLRMIKLIFANMQCIVYNSCMCVFICCAVCPSVQLYVCLSVVLSAPGSSCMCVCCAVCPWVQLYVCLSVVLSAPGSSCMCVCLLCYLPLGLIVCVFVCCAVCLWF